LRARTHVRPRVCVRAFDVRACGVRFADGPGLFRRDGWIALANLSRRHGTKWFSAFRYVAVEKLEMAYRLSDYVDFAYVMPQESPNGPIRPFLRK
jgi:hypothetical protein